VGAVAASVDGAVAASDLLNMALTLKALAAIDKGRFSGCAASAFSSPAAGSTVFVMTISVWATSGGAEANSDAVGLTVMVGRGFDDCGGGAGLAASGIDGAGRTTTGAGTEAGRGFGTGVGAGGADAGAAALPEKKLARAATKPPFLTGSRMALTGWTFCF